MVPAPDPMHFVCHRRGRYTVHSLAWTPTPEFPHGPGLPSPGVKRPNLTRFALLHDVVCAPPSRVSLYLVTLEGAGCCVQGRGARGRGERKHSIPFKLPVVVCVEKESLQQQHCHSNNQQHNNSTTHTQTHTHTHTHTHTAHSVLSKAG